MKEREREGINLNGVHERDLCSDYLGHGDGGTVVRLDPCDTSSNPCRDGTLVFDEKVVWAGHL